MKVENAVYPNEEQIAGFMEAGPDGPIMLSSDEGYTKVALFRGERRSVRRCDPGRVG